MVTLDASQPLSQEFRSAVGAQVAGFLAGRRVALDAISPALDALATRAEAFTAGGKRLRPILVIASADAVASPALTGAMINGQ